jgi:hypothetical protein
MKENKKAPRDKKYYEGKLKELELSDAVKTAKDSLYKLRHPKV